MVLPKNTFLWQAVKTAAKKSVAKHLLNHPESPLDHSFKQSCNFIIHDIINKFGNCSIAMWNIRMLKERMLW